MSALPFILKKEFKQIFRNPVILRMIIMLPVVQLIVIPLAADFEIKNICLSLVDHDHSPASRRLTKKIESSGYFLINDYSDGYNHGLREFEKGHSDVILEIPAGFEKDIVLNAHTHVLVAANAINGVKAGMGSGYLSRIISETGVQLQEGRGPKEQGKSGPVIDIKSQHLFNPHMRYPFFMVPGILVFLVTMVGAYMCSLNIVKEKETGTIEQINVTPIRKYEFILGKLIPFWIIGMLVFSIGLLGVARLLYHIIPVGSLLLIYSYLSLYLLAVLGLGLLISTYSETQQQAMSVAFFVMMIGLLMSGLFTPVSSMPEWAQWISRCNPLTYFIEVMRLVVIKGSSFRHVQLHFVVMLVMAFIFNGWALLNFRKTSK